MSPINNGHLHFTQKAAEGSVAAASSVEAVAGGQGCREGCFTVPSLWGRSHHLCKLKLSVIQQSRERGTALLALQGWVTSVRKQKEVTFVSVSDGSSAVPLQLLAPTDSLPQ